MSVLKQKITEGGEIKRGGYVEVDGVSIPLSVTIVVPDYRPSVKLALPQFYPVEVRENYFSQVLIFGDLPTNEFLLSIRFFPYLTKEEDFFSDPVKTFFEKWGFQTGIGYEDYAQSGDVIKDFLPEYGKIFRGRGRTRQPPTFLKPREIESLRQELTSLWSRNSGIKYFEIKGRVLTEEVVKDLPNLAEEIVRNAQSFPFHDNGVLKTLLKITKDVSPLLHISPPMGISLWAYFMGETEAYEKRFKIPTVVLKEILKPYLKPLAWKEDTLELPKDLSLDRETLVRILTILYLMGDAKFLLLATALAEPEIVEVIISTWGWEIQN